MTTVMVIDLGGGSGDIRDTWQEANGRVQERKQLVISQNSEEWSDPGYILKGRQSHNDFLPEYVDQERQEQHLSVLALASLRSGLPVRQMGKTRGGVQV